VCEWEREGEEERMGERERRRKLIFPFFGAKAIAEILISK